MTKNHRNIVKLSCYLWSVVTACLLHTQMAAPARKLRKKWDDDDMKSATTAVEDKSLSISQAASAYNVPRKTLDD